MSHNFNVCLDSIPDGYQTAKVPLSFDQVPTMAVAKNTKARINDYELGPTLGKGSFGEVKSATHIRTGEKFAVKIISKAQMNQESLDKEINHQLRLKHLHVVKIHEVITEGSLTFIVMELVSGGDLYSFIVKRRILEEKEARRIFQQIIAGVEHCHGQGVAHRDMKPENIFMDESGNVKIGDFGLSGEIRAGELLRESCGSLNYAAPELLCRDCAYEGPGVDVWACGVILYALLAQKLPFEDASPFYLKQLIRRGKYTEPRHVSADAKDLIARILTVNASQRISIADIRKHRWFNADLPAELAPAVAKPAEVASPTSAKKLQTDELPPPLSRITTEALNKSDGQVCTFSAIANSETLLEFLDCLEDPLVQGSVSKNRTSHRSSTTFAVSACPSEQHERDVVCEVVRSNEREVACEVVRTKTWRRVPSAREPFCYSGTQPGFLFDSQGGWPC